MGAQHALIPVGYRNRFGHPKPDVVERHAGGSARVWRTDRDGALRLSLAAGGVDVSAWRDERRRYWQAAR